MYSINECENKMSLFIFVLNVPPGHLTIIISENKVTVRMALCFIPTDRHLEHVFSMCLH